jgi:RNA polymerase sigma factor (sigma-70 family)
MTEKQKLSVDAFFRTEYRKLMSYVRKNMSEKYADAEPEDIVQEVALSLLAKLDVNIQIENLAGYIYRSLKNKITDTRRKAKNIIQIEVLDADQVDKKLLNEIPDKTEHEESEHINYSPESLHEAISKLKPDEQAIIISTEFEGKTFEELSIKWGIPIGTLLSRKHRALAKLYKILTQSKNLQTENKKDYGNKRKVLWKRTLA